MRGTAAGIFLVALLSVSGFADPAGDLLTVGRKAFADGQYALAAATFQSLANEYPESPAVEEASYLRGVSLFYAGRWSESLSAFSLFGIRHPGSAFLPRVWYWTGAANLKLGNWQSALDSLDAFLQDPGGAQSYRASAALYRAIALEGTGRDAEAADSYRQILAGSPPADLAMETTFRLAGIELRAGHFAQARDLYSGILLSGTSNRFMADSVFFTGECELALGNLAEAERRYLTIVSVYPDSPYLDASTYRLADIAWRQHRQSALQLVEDFLARFPTSSYRGSALKLRADILVDRKRASDAVTDYSRAVGLLPDGAEKQAAYYAMGLAQVSLGRKPEAAQSFGGAESASGGAESASGGAESASGGAESASGGAESASGGAESASGGAGTGGSAQIAEKAGFQRALILADSGPTGDAIEALRWFIKAFPSSAQAESAGRLLGTLLEKQGNREAARASWDWLVNRFPASPVLSEYLFRRGSDWLAAGRLSPALDDFQLVLKSSGSSPWSSRSAYSIGYAYARRGEYPRALAFFISASQAPAQGDDGPRARLSAAICLFDMGRFAQAVDAFRALAASGAPGASPGTVGLYIGRSLYRMGQLADAAAALDAAEASLAVEGSPLGAQALYWKAWALLRLRKPAEAGSAFLALAEGYPKDPRRLEALFRAAVCRTLQTDDAGAVTLFEQVIDQPAPLADDSPVIEQAMYERGLALSRIGRDADAVRGLEDLARRFPGSRLAAQAFYSRAEQAFAGKRFAEARSGFDRVRRDFPASALAGQAAYWSAQASLQDGDAQAALNGFWACLSLPTGAFPSTLLSAAVDGFSEALHRNGSVDAARRFAQLAGSTPGISDEGSAGVKLAAADMLLAGSPEEARLLAADTAAAAPPEPYAGEASLLLARYAVSRADWNRALDILGSLEGSRADDVGARAALERGRALEAMGRTSDAVDEYLKVAYRFPDLADRAAEGMANAARLSRARGDTERAAQIERSLRAAYPDSSWLQGLSPE